MDRSAKAWTQRAAEAALGVTGCLVGAWLAARLSGAWIWALLQQDGGELIRRRFGTSVAFPADTPWPLHSAGEFGPLLLFAVGLLALSVAASRLTGIGALWMTCLAFGLAMPILGELSQYARSAPSTLERLLQAAGISQGGALYHAVVSVLLSACVAVLLRSALRGTAVVNLSAFSLPAVAVQILFRDGQAINSLPALVDGSAVLGAAVAIAAGFSTRTAAAELRAPSPRAVALLGFAGIVGLALPQPQAAPQAPVRWTQGSSRNWSIQFESARFSAEQRVQWLERAEARLDVYSRRLGLPGSDTPVSVRVAASERALASLFPRRRFGDPRPRGSGAPAVIASTPDGFPEMHEIEPLLAMKRAWGEPESQAVAHAIAWYAVGAFAGESLGEAAARIACEESRYPPESVFATDGKYLSPLVRAAVGGAWVANAIERSGADLLERLYKDGLSGSVSSCDDCIPGCPDNFEPAPPRRPGPAYWKGISFSHEGRGANGYGSASAGRELGRIRSSGANAVALVPYAFTRAPEEPSIRFRTLETDARLARSIRQSRELGLHVMLKPHLWAGPRFHGSISFTNQDRFDTWFDDYRRWILHYARLAEMHRIDILSIGNELAGLTARADSWRSLVRDVRRVFRGPVTYAAHWESEIEELGFWSDLDYIGVNFYFPIAAPGSRPASDSPQMTEASERIARVRARTGKPVLFTEVGFPALATAASRPWEENLSALDADLQARCYAAWLERFGNQPGVAGMFWWKWPSDGRGSPLDTSHRPLGKPAMDVLTDWYARH